MRARRPRRGTVGVVLAVALLVVVAALAIFGGGGGDGGGHPAPARKRALPLARSARTIQELRPRRVLARVEALRGLKLKHPPKFVVLTPNQARKQVTESEDREAGGKTSKRADRISLQLVTLLGLVPKGVDLDDLAGRVTSQGTLGYYDGDTNTMTIISKGPRFPVGVETTVAHELTHAIDEAHFKVFEKVVRSQKDGDAELAYRSVVEGNATDVEQRYQEKYRIPQPDPKGDVEQQKLLHDLPFGLQLQLGFPYAIGESFVQTLRAQPNGQALLAKALGSRPPKTTVEILDPTRWVTRLPVIKTPLRPDRALGRGWTEIDRDPIGAADVLALLAPTEKDAAAAVQVARTWRGGDYRFLRRGGAAEHGCGVPCTSRDAVVGSAAFSTPEDARDFATSFGAILVHHRGATPAGTATWKVAGGGAAVGAVGTTATFAYAPTPALAVKLVRDAPGS